MLSCNYRLFTHLGNASSPALIQLIELLFLPELLLGVISYVTVEDSDNSKTRQ